MKILAIDPGPHVGVAHIDSESVQFDKDGEQEFYAFESTPLNFYARVTDWIAWADVIVVEAFIISGSRAKSSNETIEMIGVIKFLAGMASKPVVEQTPTDASAFATSDKLKRLGWWTKGSDHARSASKHLLLYCSRAGIIPAHLLSSAPEGGTA